MKKIEKTFYRCEVCEKEHEKREDAVICEQFCSIADAFLGKLDVDRFGIREKERVVKGLARVFRKMWDKDGSYRQFYMELPNE